MNSEGAVRHASFVPNRIVPTLSLFRVSIFPESAESFGVDLVVEIVGSLNDSRPPISRSFAELVESSVEAVAPD